MHAYVTDQDDSCLAWLYNLGDIASQVPAEHRPLIVFAALETDARGLDPFARVLRRMDQAPFTPSDHWTFSFDDHANQLTSYGGDQGRGSRLRRITMGQNLCNEFAMSVGASHLLFCAADCAPPGDVFPKLLEMDHPLVAPEIPTYGLWKMPGTYEPKRKFVAVDQAVPSAIMPDSDEPLYPFPVLAHMASAACVMLGRDVFRQLRWRVDGDKGMTDDPCLHHDAKHLLGIETYVRQDCIARHYPETIGPIETRGHDMTVRR
jgi:hypothetical protein